MTGPTTAFGFLIAALYGALFHLWRSGGFLRLILYLLLSIAGFWAGHFIGNLIGWTFWSIGALRFGAATIGSILFIGIGYWLSLINLD